MLENITLFKLEFSRFAEVNIYVTETNRDRPVYQIVCFLNRVIHAAQCR